MTHRGYKPAPFTKSASCLAAGCIAVRKTPLFPLLALGLFCGDAGADPQTSGNSPALTIADCRLVASEKASLAGERAGIIETITVHEGEHVEQGDVVAMLRDDVPRAAYVTAEAEAGNDVELRFAQKASELAQLEYNKALKLNSEIPGARSETEVLKLKLDAERLALQIEQARFKLQIAALRRDEAGLLLKGYAIEAPFSGTILQIRRHRGEALEAGGTVLEIANFERLRVEGLVPLAESFAIQVGQPVSVRIVIPEADLQVERSTYQGRIVLVDSAVQEISQMVRIAAEVDNSDGLLKEGLPTVMQIRKGAPTDQTAARMRPTTRR
jgi:membrane fusion protein, multidrug efflux system